MLSSQIAQSLKGRLLLEDVDLLQVAPLFMAGPSELSAVIWPTDIGLLKKSKAGAVLIDTGTAASFADEISIPMIVVDDFFEAFTKLKEWFLPKNIRPEIKKSASVHKSAQVGQSFIGEGCVIGPNVVIHDGVTIKDHAVIEAGVVIYPEVFIGEGSVIKANSVIGSEGFVPYGDPAQNLPCLGRVIIEDQVRIGALCTIDRGLLGPTTIKARALIDNLVHIGHDSIVGKNSIIAGQSGLAGFVCLGERVTCGGQVGIVPHIKVGDNARISGKSLVHCDIKSQEIWSGNPCMPHGIYLRAYASLKRANK